MNTNELRKTLRTLNLSGVKVGTYTPFSDENGPFRVRRVTVTFLSDSTKVEGVVGRKLIWTSIGNDRQGCIKGYSADI